jgi:hypothetical protein
MTWVTVRTNDIGDTFLGIYALERTFGVGGAALFVLACREKGESFASLCRVFGISRKSGYKWLKRYCAGGVRAFGALRAGSLPGKSASLFLVRMVCVERIKRVCAGGRPLDWPALRAGSGGNATSLHRTSSLKLRARPPPWREQRGLERAPEQTAAPPSSYWLVCSGAL